MIRLFVAGHRFGMPDHADDVGVESAEIHQSPSSELRLLCNSAIWPRR